MGLCGLFVGIWKFELRIENDYVLQGCKLGLDNGKQVRYTSKQVEALERLYHECPKPSSIRCQQLIQECPILSNIEPNQIKVWFKNRRYNNGFPSKLFVFMIFFVGFC